ncbi:MAG: hypothetical protein AB7G93_07510 [Bdellovibrionales bacterium]
MKTAFLSLIMVLAPYAFASAPTADAQNVARLLIHNPDVASQLSQANTDRMTDLQAVEVERGVTDYTMVFERSCHCIPATATVKIREDIRPTFADGAPEYTVSVEISK